MPDAPGPGSPPYGPCRSPHRAASPCSAPAPAPASPHGSPSPSASPAHRGTHEQTGRQPPDGCSGGGQRQGTQLRAPSGAGKRGLSPCTPSCWFPVAEGLRVQATSWGPHVLSLRHVIPQQFSGQLALGQHHFEWEGNRGLGWKLPLLHSWTSGHGYWGCQPPTPA